MLESKRIKMEVMADHPVPELDHSNSVVIGSRISRSVVKTSVKPTLNIVGSDMNITLQHQPHPSQSRNWRELAAFQRSAFGRSTAGNDVVAIIIFSLFFFII